VGKLTLSFKGKPIQAYQFEEGEIRIGREETSDIHIDSLAIAPNHALISFDKTPPLLKQLDSQLNLLVNGQKKSEHALEHGDSITVGKHTLLFTEESQSIFIAPEPSPESTAPTTSAAPFAIAQPEKEQPNAALQIMSGPNIGRLINLKKGLTRIGKKGSGMAVIAHRKNGYYLSHLDGDNPVLINGKPLENGSALLTEDDVLDIDNIKMQFFYEE
jgi:hypothetical protein